MFLFAIKASQEKRRTWEQGRVRETTVQILDDQQFKMADGKSVFLCDFCVNFDVVEMNQGFFPCRCRLLVD